MSNWKSILMCSWLVLWDTISNIQAGIEEVRKKPQTATMETWTLVISWILLFSGVVASFDTIVSLCYILLVYVIVVYVLSMYS